MKHRNGFVALCLAVVAKSVVMGVSLTLILHCFTDMYAHRLYTQISMVSCQKGPTRYAYAWQIGPFWQDTIDIMHMYREGQLLIRRATPNYKHSSNNCAAGADRHVCPPLYIYLYHIKLCTHHSNYSNLLIWRNKQYADRGDRPPTTLDGPC